MPLGYLHTLNIAIADAVANGIAQSQSPAAGAITLNGSLVASGVAVLDKPRRVVLTSGGNDSVITFTVVGTDRYGRPQSETLIGANATSVNTQRDFLTVTSVTHTGSVAGTIIIGTNGIASTAPLIIDTYSNKNAIGITMFYTGTANSSIEVARDDLSPTPTNPRSYDLANSFPNWTSPTAVTSKSSLTAAEIESTYTMIRLTQNSFSTGGACGANIVLPYGVGRY